MISLVEYFKKALLILSFSVLSIFFSNQSFAIMTVQESNEITPLGKYKLGVEPQFRTSRGSGFNFSGFMDKALNEAMSVRGSAGTGETDFSVGGSFKWVPFPDFESQPAIGFKFGGTYWRDSSENFSTIRIEPIISKKFGTAMGLFVPYTAVPVMFNNGNDYNKTSLQVAFGSEYIHSEADNMTFGAEIGLDGKDSFSYISGFVTIYLGE